MAKFCFMFGHRDAPCDLKAEVERVVERHYLEYGIRQFYVGGYGAFDRTAGSAVKEIKKRYADISLYLVLHYHPGERPVEMPDGFDGTFYPPLENVPRRFAIVRGNRYMIETSDSVICYVKYAGNTRALLEHARKREKAGELYVDNLGQTV